jgi:hypothetical protein
VYGFLYGRNFAHFIWMRAIVTNKNNGYERKCIASTLKTPLNLKLSHHFSNIIFIYKQIDLQISKFKNEIEKPLNKNDRKLSRQIDTPTFDLIKNY